LAGSEGRSIDNRLGKADRQALFHVKIKRPVPASTVTALTRASGNLGAEFERR